MGYALESAACILNKVLTKKVYKTSYEIWNGKVLNLSYLKIHKDTSTPERYSFYVDAEEHEIKWLFKKKINIDGNIHTYKARLVAKGFTQTYGVDYGETFSLVADIKAIRILIAIAAFYDYDIWPMDVKTALLNGHLNEDFYMV
ncbi:retrotransposon protein, putative, ty1-copia subclass [Tanacetum coccineum]